MFHYFIIAISKEEADDATTRGQLPYNGYSEEFLDRLEPNGNIPADKDRRYGKFCKLKKFYNYYIYIYTIQCLYTNIYFNFF